MLRLTILATFVALCSEPPSAIHDAGLVTRDAQDTASDAHALITAAAGASPLLCSYAARSVGNGGWGWLDAPVTPLPHADRRSARSDSLTPDDVAFLLTKVGNTDPCVSELAVRLLASDESDAAVMGLSRNLASPDTSIRMVSAFGLGLSGDDKGADALLRVTNDRATGVRANAIWALGRIGDGRAVRPAVMALKDEAPVVRAAAAGTLGQLDSNTAVAALGRVLGADPVAEVRRTAAWALGQLEADDAVSALATALQRDADAEVREMSAWALGNIEARSAVAVLTTAAESDTDAQVRETSVWALGNIEDAGSAQALSRIVASDQSSDVRAMAAWALGQLDLGRAPQGLIDALAASDVDLRTRAAWALGEIGDANALPAIRTAFGKETDMRARKAELRAMVRSGARSEEFEALLQSKDAEIRKTAIRAIAGHDGLDPWPWPMPRPRPFP